MLLLLILAGKQILAQQYLPIDEKQFLNTRWKFAYSAHVQSDEVIFRAEDGYEHFIWFKYDGSCHTFFNGNLTEEKWMLQKDKLSLDYSFSNVKTWTIALFNKEVLALEFTMADTAAYRYYFIRIEEKDSPFFSYNADEISEVTLSRLIKGADPHPYRHIKDEPGKRLRPASKSGKNNTKEEVPKEQPEFMQIELVGGGFFGGADPVYRNHVTIYTDGRVHRQFQTEKTGLTTWKSKISRKHLEELVLYIEKKAFFEMEQVYSCTTNDCMGRMREQPRPIALRLAVTKGAARKVITVSIWEGSGLSAHLVNYPANLDLIVKAIEDITMMPINN